MLAKVRWLIRRHCRAVGGDPPPRSPRLPARCRSAHRQRERAHRSPGARTAHAATNGPRRNIVQRPVLGCSGSSRHASSFGASQRLTSNVSSGIDRPSPSALMASLRPAAIEREPPRVACSARERTRSREMPAPDLVGSSRCRTFEVQPEPTPPTAINASRPKRDRPKNGPCAARYGLPRGPRRNSIRGFAPR